MQPVSEVDEKEEGNISLENQISLVAENSMDHYFLFRSPYMTFLLIQLILLVQSVRLLRCSHTLTLVLIFVSQTTVLLGLLACTLHTHYCCGEASCASTNNSMDYSAWMHDSNPYYALHITST